MFPTLSLKLTDQLPLISVRGVVQRKVGDRRKDFNNNHLLYNVAHFKSTCSRHKTIMQKEKGIKIIFNKPQVSYGWLRLLLTIR